MVFLRSIHSSVGFPPDPVGNADVPSEETSDISQKAGRGADPILGNHVRILLCRSRIPGNSVGYAFVCRFCCYPLDWNDFAVPASGEDRDGRIKNNKKHLKNSPQHGHTCRGLVSVHDHTQLIIPA